MGSINLGRFPYPVKLSNLGTTKREETGEEGYGKETPSTHTRNSGKGVLLEPSLWSIIEKIQVTRDFLPTNLYSVNNRRDNTEGESYTNPTWYIFTTINREKLGVFITKVLQVGLYMNDQTKVK